MFGARFLPSGARKASGRNRSSPIRMTCGRVSAGLSYLRQAERGERRHCSSRRERAHRPACAAAYRRPGAAHRDRPTLRRRRRRRRHRVERVAPNNDARRRRRTDCRVPSRKPRGVRRENPGREQHEPEHAPHRQRVAAVRPGAPRGFASDQTATPSKHVKRGRPRISRCATRAAVPQIGSLIVASRMFMRKTGELASPHARRNDNTSNSSLPRTAIARRR